MKLFITAFLKFSIGLSGGRFFGVILLSSSDELDKATQSTRPRKNMTQNVLSIVCEVLFPLRVRLYAFYRLCRFKSTRPKRKRHGTK